MEGQICSRSLYFKWYRRCWSLKTFNSHGHGSRYLQIFPQVFVVILKWLKCMIFASLPSKHHARIQRWCCLHPKHDTIWHMSVIIDRVGTFSTLGHCHYACTQNKRRTTSSWTLRCFYFVSKTFWRIATKVCLFHCFVWRMLIIFVCSAAGHNMGDMAIVCSRRILAKHHIHSLILYVYILCSLTLKYSNTKVTPFCSDFNFYFMWKIMMIICPDN